MNNSKIFLHNSKNFINKSRDFINMFINNSSFFQYPFKVYELDLFGNPKNSINNLNE